MDKGMATHSSILACRNPWTEQPGRLHTVHRVSKSQTDWATNSLTFFHNKAEWCLTWLKDSIMLHIWQEFSIWKVLNFWEISVLFLAYFSTYNSLCSLFLKFLIIWSLNLVSSIFTFLSSFPQFFVLLLWAILSTSTFNPSHIFNAYYQDFTF